MRFLLLLATATAIAAAEPKFPGTCPTCHKTVWLKPTCIETNTLSFTNGEAILRRTIHLLRATSFTAANDLYLGPTRPVPPAVPVEWRAKLH